MLSLADQFEQISLPPQDLKVLAFCKSNKVSKVSEWVSALHSTQVTQTSVLLYQAIPQILRLKTDSTTRFEMLEAMRPTIQYAISGLAKSFLSHNLSEPEMAQKTAIIALALQKNLVDGYTLCVRDLVSQKKLKPAQVKTLQTCIHRSMIAISRLIYRNYQIYTQVSATIWPQLYALFQAAHFHDALDKLISDDPNNHAPPLRIKDAFVKTIMLSCSRLNQITPHEITSFFNVLDHFVRFIAIGESMSDTPEYRFLANLSNGTPPCRHSRFDGSPDDRVIELNVTNLINQLDKLSDGGQETMGAHRLELPKEFSNALQNHIVTTWSSNAYRTDKRQSTKHSAEVCIGIIDCHTELCGGFNFESFIAVSDSEDDGFSEFGDFDSLLSGFDDEPASSQDTKEPAKRVFSLIVQNISRDGYCLTWQGAEVKPVESGEIIAIKEEGRRTWNIGTIRWIRKIKQGVQMGVQLLSTQPQAYAAAMMSEAGSYTDFMRAFYLPEGAHGNKTATIVTPAVPFREQSQVKLRQDDREVSAKFNDALLTTSKITQFSFKTLSEDQDSFPDNEL